jgi:hypothetical protein
VTAFIVSAPEGAAIDVAEATGTCTWITSAASVATSMYTSWGAEAVPPTPVGT